MNIYVNGKKATFETFDYTELAKGIGSLISEVVDAGIKRGWQKNEVFVEFGDEEKFDYEDVIHMAVKAEALLKELIRDVEAYCDYWRKEEDCIIMNVRKVGTDWSRIQETGEIANEIYAALDVATLLWEKKWGL